MTDTTGRSPALVFNPRPKSVPGDLRISWRLSMTLLVLRYCRANRASFVKLHVLNGALRSVSARRRLVEYLNGQVTVDSCTIRVEPAFSRNLDLLIGKGLGEWFVASGRLSVQLAPKALAMANAINAQEDMFTDEREFLRTFGRRVTEEIVQSIVTAGRRRLV